MEGREQEIEREMQCNILQKLTLSIQMLQKSKALAIKIINLPGDGVANICSISPQLSARRERRE